jgi:nicotinate phosphoribosyltransferase
MMTNFGKRAWDHNFNMDPIVRSRLDNDVYKPLMAQVIRKEWPGKKVTFSLKLRNKDIHLGRVIDMQALREQLDHVKSLSLSKSEQIWLTGNTFFGEKGIFSPDFIRWFSTEHRLPDYELDVDINGDLIWSSTGLWEDVMMWEIHVLAIVNEMYSRAALKQMGEVAIDTAYARAKVALADKVDMLSTLPSLKVADFGTRRRHSFLWQDYAVRVLRERLGSAMVGTSNMLIAMKNDLEAIGANAHEMPMVVAALANTDAELMASQYRVLEAWQRHYGENLRVFLPDTFGTLQFLANAPAWVADWTGMRADSMDPTLSALYYKKWLADHGVDSRERRFIASDGLDAKDIKTLVASIGSSFRLSHGWGTLLTNDFRTADVRGLAPLSLVCKVTEVDGRPTVKLSDNPAKAMGPRDEIERYRRVFGTAEEAQDRLETIV